MSPVKYYTLMKNKDKEFVFGIRLQMVRDALEKGIKPVALFYGASKNTVKKWLNRYKEKGTAGIEELSRAPHHIPHKTGSAVIEILFSYTLVQDDIMDNANARRGRIGCSHGA